MGCRPDCGACCDPVVTKWPLSDVNENGPNADFIRANWTTLYGSAEDGWAHECAKFDKVTRRCTAYEDRPPICERYPWYGTEPRREAYLPPTCGYNGDVRTMLPIVEVR